MKKFSFRYESILKMREDKVEDIKNEVRELNVKLAGFEDGLSHIKAKRSDYRIEVEEKLKTGCRGFELKNIQSSQNYFKEKIDSIEDDISHLKATIQRVEIRLIEANREKKIMEKVKEKDELDYMEEVLKAENKVIEELVNYKNFKDKQ